MNAVDENDAGASCYQPDLLTALHDSIKRARTTRRLTQDQQEARDPKLRDDADMAPLHPDDQRVADAREDFVKTRRRR